MQSNCVTLRFNEKIIQFNSKERKNSSATQTNTHRRTETRMNKSGEDLDGLRRDDKGTLKQSAAL